MPRSLNLFLKLSFAAMLSAALFGCKNDDDGNDDASKGGLTGFYVGEPVMKVLEARRAKTNTNLICQGVRREFGGNNYEDLTIVKFEAAKVLECSFGNNWRTNCESIGSLSGNTLSTKIQGQSAEIKVKKINASTLEIIEISVSGKKQDLKKVFQSPEDSRFKTVSDSDVKELNALFKDCGLL